MTDRLLALRMFVRTARSGSLSAAGRELGLSQPSVSRILSQLEEEVGATLLTRTTRAVVLTEAGQDYLMRIEPLLSALEEADHAARGAGALRGVLRIALPVSFGTREVVPRLPRFLERYCDLKVELGMTDARQDLVTEGFDVGLRVGSLPSPSAVIRKLAESPRVLVASPAYLERRGRPLAPGDLAAHAIVIGPGPTGTRVWAFTRQGGHTSLRVEARVSCSSNEGAIAAAVAGIGVANSSVWGCRAELDRGALVTILEDWPMEAMPAHAVYPLGRPASPAARAFVEYLAAQLQDERPGRQTP